MAINNREQDNSFIELSNIKGKRLIKLLLDKTDKENINKYQEEFKPLFERFLNPDKDMPIMLGPKTYSYLLEILPKYFSYLKNNVDYEDTLDQWELRHIGAILGKALIPDSIAPTKGNAKLLALDVKEFNKKKVLIRELCAGAGISTVMTYIEIKNLIKNQTTIVATDNALESIAIASLLLTIFDIPNYITSDSISNEILDFDGVILQYMDVTKALKLDIDNGVKYDHIFSDHGISYFSKPIHEENLKSINKLINSKGSVYICGLETDVKIKLNYPNMIKNILVHGGKAQERNRKIREERLNLYNNGQDIGDKLFYDVKYLDNGNMVITEFLTKETAGVYEMLHAFLFNKKYFSINKFRQYIKTIGTITKAARELGGEVQSPVSYSYEYLKDHLKKSYEMEIIPPIKEGKRMARSLRIIIK